MQIGDSQVDHLSLPMEAVSVNDCAAVITFFHEGLFTARYALIQSVV